MDAPLDSRFGCASKYLIYDTETETHRIRNNERSQNAIKGAGVRLAVQLVEKNVDRVITRHIGPIAYETLTAAFVVIYTCTAATVREAIHQLISGELIEVHGADVKAHWIEA